MRLAKAEVSPIESNQLSNVNAGLLRDLELHGNEKSKIYPISRMNPRLDQNNTQSQGVFLSSLFKYSLINTHTYMKLAKQRKKMTTRKVIESVHT